MDGQRGPGDAHDADLGRPGDRRGGLRRPRPREHEEGREERGREGGFAENGYLRLPSGGADLPLSIFSLDLGRMYAEGPGHPAPV